LILQSLRKFSHVLGHRSTSRSMTSSPSDVSSITDILGNGTAAAELNAETSSHQLFELYFCHVSYEGATPVLDGIIRTRHSAISETKSFSYFHLPLPTLQTRLTPFHPSSLLHYIMKLSLSLVAALGMSFIPPHTLPKR